MVCTDHVRQSREATGVTQADKLKDKGGARKGEPDRTRKEPEPAATSRAHKPVGK